MSETRQDDLKKLLQLKRLETPGNEYFDHFLDEFHRYQRSQILVRSSFRDRLMTVIENFTEAFSPRFMAGSTAFATLALAGFLFVTYPQKHSHQPLNIAYSQDVIMGKPASMAHAEVVAASLDYNNPVSQQPEIQRASLDEERVSSPRYITGENATPYETTLAF
jgi:hypothetical protein